MICPRHLHNKYFHLNEVSSINELTELLTVQNNNMLAAVFKLFLAIPVTSVTVERTNYNLFKKHYEYDHVYQT